MIFQENLTQCLAPLDYVAPATITNTTVNTNGIDMSLAERAVYYIQAGSLGAAGVLQVVAQTSASSTFASGIHNIANMAITNLTVNNTLTQAEIRADQIKYLQPADRYLRLALIGSGNPITAGALGVGACAPQGPASFYLNTTIVTTAVCNA